MTTIGDSAVTLIHGKQEVSRWKKTRAQTLVPEPPEGTRLANNQILVP